MEVLITLAVIGALAGLSVPIYSGLIEESRSNEAKANLQVIYLAEKIHLLDYNQYHPGGGGGYTDADLGNINKWLKTDITVQYYDIEITNSGSGTSSTGYTAKATRKGNPGRYYVLTVTNTGAVTRVDQSGSPW